MPKVDRESISSGYLDYGLEKTLARRTIQGVIRQIKKSGIEFEAIAYTGNSGALVAPAVAYSMNKNLIVVRKSANLEKAHSSRRVEGFLKRDSFAYIIIDDFVDTGSTVERIERNIRETAEDRTGCDPKLVGIFLWFCGDTNEVTHINNIAIPTFHYKAKGI